MPSIPELIIQAAQRYGISPPLAVEVGYAESRFNQAVVSPKGAIGVMQLLPATAAALGVDPKDLNQNIEGGVRYLKQQLDRFGDVAQALAAYNWGPEKVAAALAAGAAWLERAPSETQTYVRSILSRLTEWQAQNLISPATAQQASEAVQKFRGFTPQQQTALLILGAMLGLYWLANTWAEED